MLMMEVCKSALRCGGESSSESSAFCARRVLTDLESALVFTFLSFGAGSFGAGLGPAFGVFFLARGLILRDFLSFGLDFSGSTSSSSSTSTSAFASSSSLLSSPSSSPSPSSSSPSPLLASESSEELSGLLPSPPCRWRYIFAVAVGFVKGVVVAVVVVCIVFTVGVSLRI